MKKLILALWLIPAIGYAAPSNPTYGSITLQTPLPLASGGLGSTTASGARTNIGAAARGANSDITSLSGLTTAVGVSEGGTGAQTASGALTALGAAPVVSPGFGGVPTAPTAAPLNNSYQLATTGYTDSAVGVEKTRALVAESTNATAVQSETSRAEAAEALKASLASPSLTGQPTAPTASPLTNNGQIGTTGYTDAAVAVEKVRAQGAESTLTTAAAAAQSTANAALPLAGGTMTGALTVPSVTLSGSGSTGDSSAMSVLPNGAGTPNSITLAMQSAQSGVLLDTFKRVGDADDTASLTRAVATGVPILLGPRTYTINNFSTGAVSSFVLRGIPGRSVIQRTSASGSQFFAIGASTVYIDGVTFDMNSSAVTANQWGVFLGAGGQDIQITRSVFKNNSGTLGSCLNLLGTGPAAGGWFYLNDDEVTNCTNKGEFLGSVSNGVVSQQYIHDNPGTQGIYAGSYLTASSTNFLTNVQFSDNRFVRDGTGLEVGGFGPPYTFGTPAATNVSSTDNHFQDISGDALVFQGDNLWSTGDKFFQSVPTVSVNTAIDCNSRYQHIVGDTINYAGASYGIDCGGSVSPDVQNNRITMTSGAAVDSGGNQYGNYSGNTLNLSGTATGFLNYGLETDGTGNPFPTVASGTQIIDNTINMISSSNIGVNIIDDAGGQPGASPLVVKGNSFNLSGAATSTYQDILWRGGASSLTITGNLNNGTASCTVIPNNNNDILFDNVCFGGVVGSEGSDTTIRSLITSDINTFDLGGRILWVYPSAGGSNYVQSTTTLSAIGSGGGSGWAGTALVYGGSIIGVRTISNGSGYAGTITVTATDTSGGSGATFVVGNVPSLPFRASIIYHNGGSAAQLIQNAGGYVSINGSPPIEMNPSASLSLQQLGATYWNVISSTLPSYAVGSVPTCSATSNGALIGVTGSATGKWQARCNGTNWIWPDGTTASN